MQYNNKNFSKNEDIADTILYQTKADSNENPDDGESFLNNKGEIIDEIAYNWNRALVLLTKGLINEAYELILNIDDDLYLIRLMCKTGVCYSEL